MFWGFSREGVSLLEKNKELFIFFDYKVTAFLQFHNIN